jgi:hypothetical protein
MMDLIVENYTVHGVVFNKTYCPPDFFVQEKLFFDLFGNTPVALGLVDARRSDFSALPPVPKPDFLRARTIPKGRK